MTKPTLTVYGRFQYLFPPRPAVKVPQSAIAWYARRGYIAQKKKNGTCTLVFCHGKDVIFKTRHPDENDGNHLQWSPLPEHLEFFGSLGKGWNVFVAELIHSKVAGGPKNELYIFDQLVADGRELQGLTQAQRQDLMAKRWGIDYSEADEEDALPDSWRVAPHVSVARSFAPDATVFKHLFATLAPEDEGLVFKRPDARLEPCVKATSNESWQVKCRRPKRNFSF